MSTKFMGGTPHAHTEMEMQQIPGFRPRRSGMTVSRFSYIPADCACRYCTRKPEKENGCSPTDCTCLQERLEAGCVPFSALLEELSAEVGVRPFVARVSSLSATGIPLFSCDQHRRRFWKLYEGRSAVPDEAAMCAAIYLLCADTFLWGKSVMAVKPDLIDFPAIQIHGVDLNGYVLFHTAKDLYKGTRHISLSELTDPELVSDWAFQLIVKAFLIRRYGTAVILKSLEDKE